MAYSRVIIVGDGHTTQFSVNFALDYLLEADVTCRVGAEADGAGAPIYRTLTFLSTNLVEVQGAAPGNGVDIVFERTVPKDTLRVDFSNGDQLDEDNLTIAQKQVIMAVQEALDGRTVQAVDLDANAHRIINLATPIDATDAANKEYVDVTSADFIADNAATIAAVQELNAAQLVAVNTVAAAAATSESNAATSETNTENVFEGFDAVFLGTKSVDPTVDNKGNPLQDGALFWRAGIGLKAYNATTAVWGLYNPGLGISTVFGRSGDVLAVAGDYTAAEITNTPAGQIASTTVQAALNELDARGAGPTFGGRLTLQSGMAVPTTDQIGKTHLFYAPCEGNSASVYSAAAGWRVRKFTSSSTDLVGLDLNLAGSANWAQDTIHDVFLVEDAGVLKLATRAWDAGMLPTETLLTGGTVITTGTTPTAWVNASSAFNGTRVQPNAGPVAAVIPPNTVNYLGKDWGSNVANVVSKVIIYSCSDCQFTGPTGVAVEDFFVYGSNDNSTWHLLTVLRQSDLLFPNVLTIPISITEQQAYRYHRVGVAGNGTSVRVAQIEFYTKTAPANGRRLIRHDGILVNDASMTARTGATTTITTAQYEGVYLGSIHIDTGTAGQISQHVTYGPARTCGVWNYPLAARRPLKLQVGTYNVLTAYTPNTSQFWNMAESVTATSGTFYGQVLIGVADEWISAEWSRDHYMDCSVHPASYECGIAIDTTLNFSGAEGSMNIDDPPSQMGAQPRASVRVPPQAGLRTLNCIERQGNNGAGVQSAYTGPRSTQMLVEWNG